ncbi:MAG: hypothetical protein KKC75_06260 [Nanoarchaeota archaeon]|nr:hypothetical protein [Nanoarchaeota archaeon]MBU1004263.1 hypothetical protein [Nanoarchaeota archaeon]MBU1946140.1 hypothetical protein [Nanoarchaeota archaeon]
MAKKKEFIQEKLHWIWGHIMGIISLILVVAVFGGAYFFIIAPNMVSKPFMEFPFFSADALAKIKAGNEVINASHINYVINELGAYKLNKPIFTKNYPIMEFVLTDIGKMYYSYVDKHMPVTEKGNPKNPDISIRASQETVYNTLKSDDVKDFVKKSVEDGTIKFNLTADMTTLARKGYLSLYNTIT